MNDPIDYAIIGGGIAGTYCAWRLKQVYPDARVVLFEYSNRIGGRLLTEKLPHVDVNIELGGMRYLPKEHKIFQHLVDELELETMPFPMGSESDPTGQDNYAYFRGNHLRIRDFADSGKVPFNVSWSERNKTPDDLQLQIMKTLIPGWQGLKTLDDWFKVKVFGEYLWKFGFWNLLYRVLSPEAFLFLKYGSGYDTNVSNGNAVTLLPTGSEYTSDNEYRTLKDGMDALPRKLAEQFQNELQGELLMNHRLNSIVRLDNRNYRLNFVLTKTEEKRREVTTDTDQQEEWEATRVLLAMPKAALERIQWDQLSKNDFLKKNLDSVLTQDAVKIFLEYDYAWWKSIGLVRGRSITDLPIRQTFYFTGLDDMDPNIVSSKHAILMASYTDIEAVPFWKGLEPIEEQDFFDGPQDGYRASKLMVQEAHKQVMQIHGQSELPPPCAAAYFDWNDFPFCGGWHCWKAGYEYNKIIDRMRHPVESEEVYVCGEAYSAKQGWVEGALETAELLLTKDLGLTPHSAARGWIPVDVKHRQLH